MKANFNRVGTEPIPGYKLRKRIGAGGYGEVWLADAPGGLQKAVKLVFGAVGESQAESERKSLERIKEVSHPFLLSLERIEIVEQQLVIVTELAEGSLLDRFEEHTRSGQPGIPRAELLDLLKDTSDGLDFLAQKHSLQHLDVKPGNLLLIANRVKVADFGLVKDLQDQSQSLVSGLTPTYSAPEIFDGHPDFRSDQYSLAIVYMEMLTGLLPFAGKTTGELARQHLSADPNLEPLPPADRPVVARALSKSPLDRFATCRQFIEQLGKVRASAVPVIKQPEPKADADTAESFGDGSLVRLSTAATQSIQQRFLNAIPVGRNARSRSTPHCMFIGLGGTGCRALLQLRKGLANNCDGDLPADEHAWLAIDTCKDGINDILRASSEQGVDFSNAVQIPIYKPTEYRDAAPELLKPVSRRWLYNIPKSLKTEGVRPIAMLAMLDHYEALKSKLRRDLSDLVERHSASSNSDDAPLRVYLMASSHGGTGSALFCEIALLVRQIFADLGFRNYRICGNLSLATTQNSGGASMAAACTLACFSELFALMEGTCEVTPVYFKDSTVGYQTRPFDWITLLDGGFHGSSMDAERITEEMANFILADSQSYVANALSEDRVYSNEYKWLRAGSARRVDICERIDFETLSRWCVEHVLGCERDYLVGPKGTAQSAVKQASEFEEEAPLVTKNSPTASGEIPLTMKASDEFAKRILKSLGVLEPSQNLTELANDQEGNQLLRTWARRFSTNPQLVSRQMSEDMEIWRHAISSIVKMRMYNWKQIEQIQLNIIEGILDYCETETTTLVQIFEPFSKLLGPPAQMQSEAVRYLKNLAEAALKLLAQFQKQGKALAKKLDGWCSSLSTERSQAEEQWSGEYSSLSPEMQVVASRTINSLETMLQQETSKILDSAIASLQLQGRKSPLVSESLTLSHVMVMSRQLVTKAAEAHSIDPPDTGKEDTKEAQHQSIKLSQLDTFNSAIALEGAELYRFAIVSNEQRAVMAKTLKEQGLYKTTTIVPCVRSLGSFLLCEGVQNNISHAISRFCRPSPKTLQLADRLRTRMDVEWPPIQALFEIENSAKPADQGAPSVDGARTECLGAPTGQLENWASATDSHTDV